MDKTLLVNMYGRGASMNEIASRNGCSVNRVRYWMNKYGIERRGISDAIYLKNNPDGDPFTIKPISSIEDALLMGMGIGLFWGEGNKANKHSVRLGNSDPKLLMEFIRFLTDICGVKKDKLRFSLQIFSDMNPESALNYWAESLDVTQSQFYKITVTITGSIGTYRKKSPYGVLQVYFHNKKLRDTIVNMLPM